MEAPKSFLTFLILASFILTGARCGRKPDIGSLREENKEESFEGKEEKISVDSADASGAKFVVPKSGLYKITFVSGAYRHLPEDNENWPKYGGWRTRVHFYVNRPIEWGAPDEWGSHPINSDYAIGSDKHYSTPQKSETAEKGSSIKLHLDKDNYVTAIISDGSDYYFDNYGTLQLSIIGP